ncbi:MAG: OmpA family protein [Bacteroidetes bacterium]|nr:OmpA family protein [Bacteroidota bacterium]MBU1719488.1 OmpA family protein [Bacteroidota bacterium]
MKKTIRILAFATLAFSMVFSSCVSGKKFKASEASVNQLQKDSAVLQSQLNRCNTLTSKLTLEKAALQASIDIINTEYNNLSTESEKTISKSELTIAEQARLLKNFRDMIQAQKDVMSVLKNSIANALMKYKTDELSVYIKDGNVYVSLEEKLLFKSGSDVVDPKGKEALKSLAKVLNATSGITVMIEGHTDSIPIQTNKFKDNWDLSTARATSILRILTKDNGFDPMLITASGRGEFHPIKSNKTAEGRASNRRTEIILSPDLKELYKLLY